MISPLAQVHPDAKIGANVTVDAFAFIAANTIVGDNSWIGAHATLFEGARIGQNCRIFPGAVISGIPQDLKFGGENTTAEIGDNSTIREFVTINRGTKDKFKTSIGKNCLLMAYAHVAHDCIIGDNVILANNVGLSGHCLIEDWAILEGMVGVSQFVHIGTHAFIGGMTAVRKNVPPFVKAAREPLSYVGVNTVGLRRRGYSNESIGQIEDIYRTLYVKGLNVTNAVAIIEKEAPQSKEKEQILAFIRASKDGIIRGIS
ncbi:MAG TPA: acyl-ACP--UDP-N-acetylglucosamine O-acyltransferase [Bacteroidia bacterium]|nr:acyl-ACP--UDP-N-acetylglucosamine O-acyltransferase [Bacteroidia bacterium]